MDIPMATPDTQDTGRIQTRKKGGGGGGGGGGESRCSRRVIKYLNKLHNRIGFDVNYCYGKLSLIIGISKRSKVLVVFMKITDF